jgi:hypothetical protein
VTDLRAFIEARLAEDESVALAASGSTPGLQKAGFSARWHTEPLYDGTGERCVLRAGVAGDLTGPYGIEVPAGEHAARHDPARVLREVAAKRRRIELAQTIGAERGHPFWPYAGEQLLKLEAAAWSDHPDYLTEWAP